MKCLILTLCLLFAQVTWAAGETCSSTPCASDGSNTSCDTVGEIDAKIDAAADNAVVCLKRGSSWSTGGVALTFGTHHPGGSRVLVCASDATVCTDSGSANPAVTITDGAADGITFSATGDGYTIQNLDLINSGTPNDAARAYGETPEGLSDISFLGGDLSGWRGMISHNVGGTDLMSNIDFGTCSHILTVHNGFHNGNHALAYGPCKNCNYSMYVYDWGPTSQDNGQTHMLDWTIGDGAPRPGKDQTHESSDITVSCSHFVTDPGQTNNGYIFKVAAGVRLTVRDSFFEMLDGAVADSGHGGVGAGEACPGAINFGGHTGPPTNYEWGWDGAEIYRNIFQMQNCYSVIVSSGTNVNIYNNLFIHDWNPGDWWFYTLAFEINDTTGCTIGGCTTPNNVTFYNNSIFLNQNGSGTDSNGGADIELAGQGTGHKFYNNVIQDQSVSNGNGAIITNVTCGNFGTNGVNIHNNYVYSPNDSTPVTGWSGCSAASNPTTYSTDPGLAAPTNTGLSAVDRLKITEADTLLWKMGSGGAPGTDYLGLTRPSPASVGALDVPILNQQIRGGFCSGCTIR